jgi:hypothetical protein
LLTLVALVLVGAVAALGPGAPTVAQEATPIIEADDTEAFAGLSAQLLAVVNTPELPSPATLEVISIEFAPGSGFALNPDDPAVGLVYVATGTLTFRVEAPIVVQRGSPGTPPDPANAEEIPAGEIFTMSEGDSAIFQPRTVGETLNEGEEPAIILVVNIYPQEGAPVDAEPAATPVA